MVVVGRPLRSPMRLWFKSLTGASHEPPGACRRKVRWPQRHSTDSISASPPLHSRFVNRTICLTTLVIEFQKSFIPLADGHYITSITHDSTCIVVPTSSYPTSSYLVSSPGSNKIKQRWEFLLGHGVSLELYWPPPTYIRYALLQHRQ